MSDIKLNNEQIEELKKQYARGRRFLMKQIDSIFVHKNITVFKERIMTDSGSLIFTDFKFLESFGPFYFGDLFEVVYKGNK